MCGYFRHPRIEILCVSSCDIYYVMDSHESEFQLLYCCPALCFVRMGWTVMPRCNKLAGHSSATY